MFDTVTLPWALLAVAFQIFPTSSLIFFFFFLNLIGDTFFLKTYVCSVCGGSLLLHVGFRWLWRSGAALCCGAQAAHCCSLSCGARALGAWASVAAACGLSSCSVQAYLLCSMWDLPEPGIKPVSPASQGGLLTAEPPAKPQ